MIIEGIFDGTTVRPIETCVLEPNQKVFINIPNKPLSNSDETTIKQKLSALDNIFGILTKEEGIALDKSLNEGIKIKTL